MAEGEAEPHKRSRRLIGQNTSRLDKIPGEQTANNLFDKTSPISLSRPPVRAELFYVAPKE